MYRWLVFEEMRFKHMKHLILMDCTKEYFEHPFTFSKNSFYVYVSFVATLTKKGDTALHKRAQTVHIWFNDTQKYI